MTNRARYSMFRKAAVPLTRRTQLTSARICTRRNLEGPNESRGIEIRIVPAVKLWEAVMSDVVYVSKVGIERKVGPLRIANLPGESRPVTFSVHGLYAM